MGSVLGQYIKSARKLSKMSAMALSKAAGISKSYLDYIESGAREPKPDILARIAVPLGVTLDALIEQQKKDQLQSAVSKLEAQNTNLTCEGLLALGRSADDEQTVDERALAMTQAAFRASIDDSKYAEYISNPELREILKVGARLTDEQLAKVRKIMEMFISDEPK